MSKFQITAEHAGEAQTASRAHQNSAMSLADKWAEKGFKNIRITDSDGLLRDRPQFRRFLWSIMEARHAKHA